MALHKSAKKRIRRNARAELVNKSRLSRTRTSVRKVEEAINLGDAAAAKEAFRAAQPELHRTASKKILSKKTVARKLSRLSARIKNLVAAQ